MRELRKEEKDIYIMGKLKCKGISSDVNDTAAKRKRCSFYSDDREVCRNAFLFTHDFGEKAFKNLIKHMNQNGLTTRTHGNTEDCQRIASLLRTRVLLCSSSKAMLRSLDSHNLLLQIENILSPLFF